MSGRTITTLLSAVAAAALMNVSGATAQAPSAALTGVVSSTQEGNMEGVIVTAENDVLVSSGLEDTVRIISPPTDRRP